MQVLIVESEQALGDLWRRSLERQDAEVGLATTEEHAIAFLRNRAVDVIIMDVHLETGSALAVADFARYLNPLTRVVFVTKTTFFSDGSIFQLVPNAAAFLRAEAPPDDIAAIAEHHGNQARAAR